MVRSHSEFECEPARILAANCRLLLIAAAIRPAGMGDDRWAGPAFAPRNVKARIWDGESCLARRDGCAEARPSGFVGPGSGSAARVVSRVLLRGQLVVAVHARVAVVLGAGGPAGEQAQGVVRGRTGLRGVGEQALGRFGGDREGLEREVKIPDDRVMDELDAGGVDPGRCARPTGPGTGRYG